MRSSAPSLLLCSALLAAGLASAQPAPRTTRVIRPIAPAAAIGRTSPSPAIIVQGGISPDSPCGAPATGTYSDANGASDLSARGTGAVAIGPKQDDPAGPRPTPARDAATGMAAGQASLAIGPKQDDPAPPPQAARSAASGMAADRGAVAIGPKQDDPTPPSPADLSKCMPAAH